MKSCFTCPLTELIVITVIAGLHVEAQTNLFADLTDLEAPLAVTSPEPAAPSAVLVAPVVEPAPDSAPRYAEPRPSAAEAPLDVDEYLSRGKALYAEEDWAGAEKRFEAVLQQDPYHEDAIKWLRRTADKKAVREVKSYQATRARMLETVQAAWNTPKAAGEPFRDETVQCEPTASERQADALRNKLEVLRIPHLSFQEAEVQCVITELSTLCRELDPDHSGVNLVIFGATEARLPPVTFSARDLSAREVLEIITQISGMKYEVGPNLVSITPVHYESPQQMVSAEFDLMPSVGNKMAARTTDQPGGLRDVRDFFSTVPFPPGSSAQYNPEFNVLLVRNAPKYIENVTTLLDRYHRKELEERSRQVEIETKFIEVEQGALDELGFNWTLGEPGSTLRAGAVGMPGGQQLFTDSLRDGQDAFGSAIPSANRASAFNSYAGDASDPTGSGLVGTASELMVQKIKGTPVDVVIRALERTAGSDLLSAPKILTKSGETARIHVGEVHWFPSAYDVEIERYAQPSLVPLDYLEERTGVMLEVTPELDPDHGTINMKLSPEIRELTGFDEQHVSTILPTSGDESLALGGNVAPGPDLLKFLTAREEGRTVNADRLIARRPVFKTRKVDTSVTIEDGSTIAMGGLIKEQLQTFKDSVPILGKIPLLGRLFRSEGEQSVKRNLLIFVTANQVNASGYKYNNQ